MRTSRCSLIPSDVLDRSQIIRELGSGISGPISLISTPRGNFALKSFQINEFSGIRKGVLSEVDTLVKLRPFSQIIQVEGICIGSNSFGTIPLNILMEVMEGNLTDLIRYMGVVERLTHLEELIRPMIYALALLEEANIYHFDIKPDNILYRRNYNGLIDFKISDVGLARPDAPGAYLHNVVYTLAYRPPEFLVNRNRQTFSKYRSDLWALGLTFLEFIIGHRVFNATQPDELIEELVMVIGEDLTEETFRKEIRSGQFKGEFPIHNYYYSNLYFPEYEQLRDSPWTEIIQKMLTFNVDDRPDISQLMDDYNLEKIPYRDLKLLIPPVYPRKVSEEGIRIISALTESDPLATIIGIEIYTRYLGLFLDHLNDHLNDQVNDHLNNHSYAIASAGLALKYILLETSWSMLLQRYREYILSESIEDQFSSLESGDYSKLFVQAELDILVQIDFMVYNLDLSTLLEEVGDNLEVILMKDPQHFAQPVAKWTS